MSQYTIYELEETELQILEGLEWSPERFVLMCKQHGVCADNMRLIVAKMIERRLIWNNVKEATFMITHAGIANLRARGRYALKRAAPIKYYEAKKEIPKKTITKAPVESAPKQQELL